MKILNVKLVDNNTNLHAFFDIETSEGLLIKGFKITNGKNGLFVGVPSEKGRDGKYYDKVVMPRELRDEVNKIGVAEYERQGGKVPPPISDSSSF